MISVKFKVFILRKSSVKLKITTLVDTLSPMICRGNLLRINSRSTFVQSTDSTQIRYHKYGIKCRLAPWYFGPEYLLVPSRGCPKAMKFSPPTP